MRVRGNSYQIDIHLTHARHFHTLPKSKYSYEDALALEAEIRKELGKVKHSKDDINSKVNEYLEWVELHQSPVTLRKKKYVLASVILPHFGHLTPERITEGLINAYKNKRKLNVKSKRSKGQNKTINDELLVLRHLCKKMFKFRLEAELLPYTRELPTVLTKDEVHRFLDALEPKYKFMFGLMYYAGLRKSEVINLKWENIQGNSIILGGKGGRWRSVPLSDVLIQTLDFHRENIGTGTSGLIFPSYKGLKYNNIYKAIARARKKTGIEKHIYPHLLRHSFGTHIIEGTGDMRTLQELLGHAKISTTMIYTHITSEQKKKVLEGGVSW